MASRSSLRIDKSKSRRRERTAVSRQTDEEEWRWEGMGNEERTNIVPTILLGNLYGGLANELFNLNEKEDSKERVREKFQRTACEEQARRKSEPIKREKRRAPREIRIIIFATRYCHLRFKEYIYHNKIMLDTNKEYLRNVYVFDFGETWYIYSITKLKNVHLFFTCRFTEWDIIPQSFNPLKFVFQLKARKIFE